MKRQYRGMERTKCRKGRGVEEFGNRMVRTEWREVERKG